MSDWEPIICIGIFIEIKSFKRDMLMLVWNISIDRQSQFKILKQSFISEGRRALIWNLVLKMSLQKFLYLYVQRNLAVAWVRRLVWTNTTVRSVAEWTENWFVCFDKRNNCIWITKSTQIFHFKTLPFASMLHFPQICYLLLEKLVKSLKHLDRDGFCKLNGERTYIISQPASPT